MKKNEVSDLKEVEVNIERNDHSNGDTQITSIKPFQNCVDNTNKSIINSKKMSSKRKKSSNDYVKGDTSLQFNYINNATMSIPITLYNIPNQHVDPNRMYPSKNLYTHPNYFGIPASLQPNQNMNFLNSSNAFIPQRNRLTHNNNQINSFTNTGYNGFINETNYINNIPNGSENPLNVNNSQNTLIVDCPPYTNRDQNQGGNTFLTPFHDRIPNFNSDYFAKQSQTFQNNKNSINHHRIVGNQSITSIKQYNPTNVMTNMFQYNPVTKDSPNPNYKLPIMNNASFLPTNVCCNCYGCTNLNDCGNCAVCKTMHKFGGPFFKTSKKCILKLCLYDNPNLISLHNQRVVNEPLQNNEFPLHAFRGPPKNNTTLPKLRNVKQTYHPSNVDITNRVVANSNCLKQPPQLVPSIQQPQNIQNINKNINEKLAKRIDQNVNNTLPSSKILIPIKHALSCHAIGCNNRAMVKSKYCSSSCGRKTNLERMKKILQHKLSTVAFMDHSCQTRDTNTLNNLKRKLKRVLKKIKSQKQLRLKHIAYFKNRPISMADEKEPNNYIIKNIINLDSMFMCPCCRSYVWAAQAVKHVETCYIKVEKIYSYVSTSPSNEEFMCDRQLKKPEGFCKRLFSNCVDHKNMEKFDDNVICGFFFENESNSHMMDSSSNCTNRIYADVCDTNRNKCVIHFGWERTRLAYIEQTLQNLCQNRSTIEHNLNSIRIRMKHRKSVVGNYLHKSPTKIIEN